jgi:uncharacterized protein (DUF2236 family)
MAEADLLVRTPVGRYSAPKGDPGWFGPDSVAWQVHADLASMLVGGLSALMLQTLHPLVMQGVDEHSNYRQDPFGRLQRTAEFIAGTTYGGDELAGTLVRRVRSIHAGVRGEARIAGMGRYRASDPALLTYVHVTEVWSFLAAHQRYSGHPLLVAEKNRYLGEMSVVAERLGARDVPVTTTDMRGYLRRVRPTLVGTEVARRTVRYLTGSPFGSGVAERYAYATPYRTRPPGGDSAHRRAASRHRPVTDPRGRHGPHGTVSAALPAPGVPLPHVLREYSFIADSRRGALVGPRGDLVWMCAPAWQDDAVFSAMIGGRGHYTVAPADPWFVWGGYYEPRSLIFRSHWVSDRGVVECREALSYPGDPHRAVILRRVMASDTPVKLRVELNPRAGFGASALRHLRCEGGVWTGRTGPLRLRWMGGEGAHVDADGALVLELPLRRGRAHDFVLEVSDEALPSDLPDADALWSETENTWATLATDCSQAAAPRDAEQALAVLQGLTCPGGGMVAAPTMSLPERAEAGRNYDYRYSWIRDQCYAGLAAASLGSHPLVSDAVSFVTERLLEDGPRLAPAYTTAGAPVPDERRLRGLRGYPGGSVKAGNWVNGQFQLDALGESLKLMAAAARNDLLTSEARKAVDVAVKAIRSRWKQPDAGIWEVEPDWWAQSRLECVAGLRSVAATGLIFDAGTSAECETLADRILTEVGRRCTHPSGRWQRSPDDERVDASLVLPPVRGAVGAADPRTVATYHAVRDDLARDGYLYRFRQDLRPLHEAEGAFLLCGFMMVLAALQQGDRVEAWRWFERNRAACGSPGLLAEEYDVQQRQLRGNIPQAFVHAILLESSVELGKAS